MKKRAEASVEARAAMHWLQRELGMAFNKWREYAEQAHSKDHVARALQHWLYKQVGQAFNRWREFIIEMEMSRALARKSVLAWTHKALLQAFNKWDKYYEEALDYKEKQRQPMDDAAQQRLRLLAVRAFNQWMWVVEQAQARQELMFKAMFRWAHRDLSRAMDTWRQTAADLANSEEAMLIANQHFRFAQLCTALQYLRDSLAASQEEANR